MLRHFHPVLVPLVPLTAALLLVGCAVTAVAPPPPAIPAAQYKEAGAWQRASATNSAADARADAVPDAWWTLFRQPVLDDLQQRLLVGNQNLQSLAAAMASARAVLDASRSARYPTLSAGLSATRSASPTLTTPAGVQNPSNSLALTANASWEIDLWGRLALATSGAKDALQASADDLASARLSAQATLTQTYLSLRAADAQLALLARSVAAYQRSLDLTQLRYSGGVAARSDVLQAQTLLKTTQAQAADLTAQRALLEHAIAVLLGAQPSALGLERVASLPDAPVVPAMLPATLLERRPDIAAAQRRVAAAYAQIGIADAAFFPDLSLSASAGYRTTALASLINTPNLFWSLGPALTQAILDGGARRLASAQARASADQATAAYRQTVLTALQEVEDNLVLTDQLQHEAQFQQEALQAARSNLDITFEQYRAGTVSYLNVVVAQTTALNSEVNLLGVRNRQLAAVTQLLKNIAGRWERV